MDSVENNGIKMDSALKNSLNRFLSTNHTQEYRSLYRVGLTGHPGSGKSLVLKWLQQLGFATIQCDLITQRLYCDPQIQREVLTWLGFELDSCSSANSNHFKQVLKSYIGINTTRLKKVSQVMQPKIRNKIEDAFKKLENTSQKCVIVEVPLLYEANWKNLFDCIIHIMRDQEQLAAQLAQRGWSEEYSALLRSQYKPAAYYTKHADITLTNHHSKLNLWTQVKTIIKELK